jgi:hypothetical protein
MRGEVLERRMALPYPKKQPGVAREYLGAKPRGSTGDLLY